MEIQAIKLVWQNPTEDVNFLRYFYFKYFDHCDVWDCLHDHLSARQRHCYPKSVQYMTKTKRPRKVHFVWADTNDIKCEARVTADTLFSKWVPDVTCSICRQMMINRGITRIV